MKQCWERTKSNDKEQPKKARERVSWSNGDGLSLTGGNLSQFHVQSSNNINSDLRCRSPPDCRQRTWRRSGAAGRLMLSYLVWGKQTNETVTIQRGGAAVVRVTVNLDDDSPPPPALKGDIRAPTTTVADQISRVLLVKEILLWRAEN